MKYSLEELEIRLRLSPRKARKKDREMENRFKG